MALHAVYVVFYVAANTPPRRLRLGEFLFMIEHNTVFGFRSQMFSGHSHEIETDQVSETHHIFLVAPQPI